MEPLPDIDFNIRSGNSLVGFANMAAFEKFVSTGTSGQVLMDLSDGLIDEVREQAALVQKANNAFKRAQDAGGEDYRRAKAELSERLDQLNNRMNHYLAKQYGKDKKKTDYEKWLVSHRPFHWLAEFYGIVEEDGGFDVVIGNPPYLKATNLKYTILADMPDFQCPDIYGYFLIRAYGLATNAHARVGFIVMHNLAFHKKFQKTRCIIKDNTGNGWFSFYSRIPSGLFNGDVRVRNCIFFGERSENPGSFYTTRLHRWQSAYRNLLFSKVQYTQFDFSNIIPMFNDDVEASFFQNNAYKPIASCTVNKGPHFLIFKQSAYNWISVSLESPPCFDGKGEPIPQTRTARILLKDKETKRILLLLFGGRMFFTNWLIYGGDFNVTSENLLSFRLPVEKFSRKDVDTLLKLSDKMANEFENIVQFKLNAGKKVGSYNTARLWHITNESDLIFLKYMTDQHEQVFESMAHHVSQTAITSKLQSEDEINDR